MGYVEGLEDAPGGWMETAKAVRDAIAAVQAPRPEPISPEPFPVIVPEPGESQ
jgi:hypothetical protein